MLLLLSKVNQLPRNWFLLLLILNQNWKEGIRSRTVHQWPIKAVRQLNRYSFSAATVQRFVTRFLKPNDEAFNSIKKGCIVEEDVTVVSLIHFYVLFIDTRQIIITRRFSKWLIKCFHRLNIVYNGSRTQFIDWCLRPKSRNEAPITRVLQDGRWLRDRRS